MSRGEISTMKVIQVLAALLLACLGLGVTVANAAKPNPYPRSGAAYLDYEQYAIDVLTTNSSHSLAGGHPDVGARIEFKHEKKFQGSHDMPYGRTQRIEIDLPDGLVANVRNFDACSVEKFFEYSAAGTGCPASSRIGIARVVAVNAPINSDQPVFVLEHGPDQAVLLGIKFTTAIYSFITARLKPDGGVTAIVDGLPIANPVMVSTTTLWGVPADFSGSGLDRLPFVSAPTECESVPTTRMRAWSFEGKFDSAFSTDPVPIECELVPFEPQFSLTPTSNIAGAPTGLKVRIDVPQTNDPDGRATAHVKDVKVELPEGMTVSPSAANGLDACSSADYGYRTESPMRCPDASKIGSVSVFSPVLDGPMDGDVYLAKQYDNPFNSLMALYIHVHGWGLEHKIAGRVDPDPVTGQLVATFDGNPQLPWNRMDMVIKSGPRAPLVNPRQCGDYEAKARFGSWARHEINLTSEFVVDEGCRAVKFEPTFGAGTVDPLAAGSTEFSMRITRPDGDEELKGINQVKMPLGLVGDVSSVELCSDHAADAGTCGEDSRVGRVDVSAGPGGSPVWVPEAGKDPTRVHLTGPYSGAPYGLSIVVPAQAGPFDLGRIVVRSALHVDERTAQITSGVDQTRIYNHKGQLTGVIDGHLPRIIEGVVLNQREIRVNIDRPGFMINPTNCSQQQVSAQLVGFAGSTVDAADQFRAADCSRLGFAPKFRAKILDKGRKSTLRSWHPRTRFTVVPRKGDANIGGARVALPSSTILDQGNIGTTCTRAQMAARDCPEKSIVGYAKAWSPLLRRAVEGPVYLAANGGVRPLPDIAAVLDGEIRVVLQGEVSTLRTGGKARLQNTFRVVPDAPVNRFVLTMRGGKKTGLLVNSTDLCRSNQRGVAAFQGQNGRSHRLNLRIGLSYKGCGKIRRQSAAKRKAARKVARKAMAAAGRASL